MKAVIFICLSLAGASMLFAAPQVYFSPDGNVREKITAHIDESFVSIDVMCFNFTSRALAESLIKAGGRGVRIRVLLDKSEAKDHKSMSAFLRKSGIELKQISGIGKEGIMHNKVAIFDSKCVFTGSYNWTGSAEHFNYENAVFLDDAQAIFDYQVEFNRLWDGAN